MDRVHHRLAFLQALPQLLVALAAVLSGFVAAPRPAASGSMRTLHSSQGRNVSHVLQVSGVRVRGLLLSA